MEKGRHLHFDAPAGIAGDMALGALVDLGVSLDEVKAVLRLLPVTGYELTAKPCLRRGLRGLDVKVLIGPEPEPQPEPAQKHSQPHSHGHGHSHEHDHRHGEPNGLGLGLGHGLGSEHGDHGSHGHRHYREIRAMLALLPDSTRRLATSAFDRVAAAESHLHGVSVDDVVFHEVGAVDSIVDIVGTAAALAILAPASISCTPLPLGHGTVRCAHGLLPVPAPATLEILRAAKIPSHDGDAAFELTTPTGATIAAWADTFTAAPPGRILAVGYGAGDRELADRPNLLRAVLIDPVATSNTDQVVHIEANLDDMSPELCEHVGERLFAAGALDVWWQPIIMKKSRPAFLLGVIAPPSLLDRLSTLIFAETSTIGLRHTTLSRRVLDRRIDSVPTQYGPIRVKRAFLAGRQQHVAPEYEDCRAAALAHEVPLKQVYAAALAAAGGAE